MRVKFWVNINLTGLENLIPTQWLIPVCQVHNFSPKTHLGFFTFILYKSVHLRKRMISYIHRKYAKSLWLREPLFCRSWVTFLFSSLPSEEVRAFSLWKYKRTQIELFELIFPISSFHDDLEESYYISFSCRVLMRRRMRMMTMMMILIFSLPPTINISHTITICYLWSNVTLELIPEK